MAELDGLPVVGLLRLAKTVMPALSLAVEMERTARGAPTTILEERSTVESVAVEAVVEVPRDPGRLQEVAAILRAAGALDFGPPSDATGDTGQPDRL